MTTTVPDPVDYLFVIQDYDSTLQKHWLLAHGTHADYNFVHKLMGEFLTFKGQLYILKN